MSADRIQILVLEDERQLAGAIKEAFDMRGFEPIIVASVEDGIMKLKEHPNIKVVWLDHYLLGSGNGLDFVVKLKNNEDWKNIPIFVVSNTASATNVNAYIQLGVNNYYTKSDYDINQIINDIEFALNNKEQLL